MKSAKRPRPKLSDISEEMKAWSAALAGEVRGWPKVSTRSFFGLTALDHRDRIFALLPRTRGMETPNALAFLIAAPSARVVVRREKDPRIGFAEIKQARWFSFELSSDDDLHDALDWLGRVMRQRGSREVGLVDLRLWSGVPRRILCSNERSN